MRIYAGLSYEAASKEGARLISEAQKTGYWMRLPEQLAALGEIMEREYKRVA